MASVTVPSGTATPIGQIFGNANNSLLANQIATAIANAAKAHTLGLTNITVPGAIPSPPANPAPGAVNELIISAGGEYTIPPSLDPANPDYVVVLNSKDPVTIHGAPNSSIWGGIGQVTIVDPAVVTLSEGASNPVVNLTGDGDLLAANDSAETVTASGANDTILAGGGKANITLSGSGALVSGSTVIGEAGGLNVTDSGFLDTISAGSASAAVTLAGSGALVSGGTGALSVVDNGSDDTINAGSGSTAVNASGADTAAGTLVHGGTGLLNFVGGAANSTIFGGSGDETVSGGTGNTTLFGGDGGAITYVNTTAGSMFFGAGSGNETADASLAKANDSLYGSVDPTSHNLLMGGAGDDLFVAGTGADTLVGGGGHNAFYFFSLYGSSATNHVVGDFSSLDEVVLSGYGPGGAAAAMASATTTGGSTTITLSDNTKITFTGVTNIAALTDHLFSI